MPVGVAAAWLPARHLSSPAADPGVCLPRRLQELFEILDGLEQRTRPIMEQGGWWVVGGGRWWCWL